MDSLVFEGYPLKNSEPGKDVAKIGLQLASELDDTIETLRKEGIAIVTETTKTQLGRRAIVLDQDSRTVELMSAL